MRCRRVNAVVVGLVPAVVAGLVTIGAVVAPVSAVAADGPPAAIPLPRWEVAATEAGPWRTVDVPHLFDQTPVEARFAGTTGVYRVRFDRPTAPDDFGWGVRFGAVRRAAAVSVNGRPIGTHRDPYVPFTLPLGALRETGNVLTVRVDSRKGAEPREGWWNWGGLARPVALVPLGRLAAEEPALLSDVRCAGPGRCTAAFRLDATVRNRSAERLVPSVRVAVDGVGERTVAGRSLAPGETARLALRLPVRAPRLWSPGSPVLYRARIEIRAGDRVEQVVEPKAGLRSVAVHDGLLLVNGRAARLRGASIQEDLPERGAALRDEDVTQIVADLRAVGANVTRAHYLLDDRLLDALDEAGIMVWSQAPIYHRDDLLATAGGRAEALETVRRTVLAARRHPSVLTHSVANELAADPDRTPGTAAFLRDALAVTRDTDPTLPVSVDLLSYPGYATQRAFAAYDLLGINSYFGWYPGKRERSTARIEDLGPFLDRVRRQYPRQGLVLTEFGAESTFHGPPSVKETYAFQQRYVRDVLAAVDARPWLGGAIHWTLREFAVKPDWDGGANRKGVERDGIHNKGLLTYGGRPKPAWRVARSSFSATPALREDPRLPGAVPAAVPLDLLGLGLLASLLVLIAGLLALAAWAAGAVVRRAPPPVAAARPALRAVPERVRDRSAA